MSCTHTHLHKNSETHTHTKDIYLCILLLTAATVVVRWWLMCILYGFPYWAGECASATTGWLMCFWGLMFRNVRRTHWNCSRANHQPKTAIPPRVNRNWWLFLMEREDLYKYSRKRRHLNKLPMRPRFTMILNEMCTYWSYFSTRRNLNAELS